MLKPGDNYCVRSEHEIEDKARRELYMSGKMSHHDYYMYIARDIGEIPLRAIVASIVRGHTTEPDIARVLYENLKRDSALNTISLRRWDAQHYAVTRLAHSAGWRVWTLGDSVCLLKAVAIEIASE